MTKEATEQLVNTARENHSFRYTQLNEENRMNLKVGLTYACLNFKKLVFLQYFISKPTNTFPYL